MQGATGDFADNAVIGEGGFGKVFRGTLEDGTPVAIKRLDRLGLQVKYNSPSASYSFSLWPACVLPSNGLCTVRSLDMGPSLS